MRKVGFMHESLVFPMWNERLRLELLEKINQHSIANLRRGRSDVTRRVNVAMQDLTLAFGLDPSVCSDLLINRLRA